jgi:apolipoprotein N-acyltransferase
MRHAYERGLFYFLSLTLGIFYYFCFSPHHYTFMGFFIFPFLYFMLLKTTKWTEAFGIGFFFWFSLHYLGMFWISDVLKMPINNMGYLSPFAITLLPGAIACFLGGACSLFFWAKKPLENKTLLSLLLFAVCYSLAELSIGHFFGGFPWFLVAYVFENIMLLQLSSLVGAYGLGFIFIVIFLFGGFFLLPKGEGGFKKWGITSLGVIIFIGTYLYGENRIDQNFDLRFQSTNLYFRLVSTDIDSGQKWTPGAEYKNFEDLLKATKEGLPPQTQAIIWPETSIAYDLIHDEETRKYMVEAFPKNMLFMVGGLRHTPKEARQKLYNTLVVLKGTGQVLDYYDKFKLVPFGEYVPLLGFLPIHSLVEGLMDYSEGEGLRTLKVEKLPSFVPLICYEALFPGHAKSKGSHPQWILNITNDGWFTTLAVQKQHLMINRMRAIEEGIPMLRVANLGITCVIDPLGRIEAKLQSGYQKALDVELPQSLKKQTFFGKYGNLIFFMLLIFIVFFIYAYDIIYQQKKNDY